jgi:hypothetical protein
MNERPNWPANVSACHPEPPERPSDPEKPSLIHSGTATPTPSASWDHLSLTDPAVHARTLLEVRQLLQDVGQMAMPDCYLKSLLRAELRVCFLILHFGSNQLRSLEWCGIHSRSQSLRKRLVQLGGP